MTVNVYTSELEIIIRTGDERNVQQTAIRKCRQLQRDFELPLYPEADIFYFRD